MVDELRYPSVFPKGVHNVGEFLRRFMPNTHRLWRRGVKFANHFTAGVACTPARGVLVSGLYTQQSWLLQTLKGTPDTKVSIPPILDPAYPTYGKLLRQARYLTPYVGKWHVSLPRTQTHPLELYGFDGMTLPDPTGSNLQGAVGNHAQGYLNDQDIANQAVQWLSDRKPSDPPWCLTVSFVNPHDKEFFWAGTEFKTYNGLFNRQATYTPQTFYSHNEGTLFPPTVSWRDDPFKNPPSFGYPELPPNWESAKQIANRKTSTQTFARIFQGFVWGAASDDPGQTGFDIAAYPATDLPNNYGIGVAPFRYWQRSLDCYTLIMNTVDQRIGEVLDALPPAAAKNTVIVFCSDHGEYAGAHGFLSGKAGSGYDEAYHVPLIVVDFTGQFAREIDTVRTGLTSSVDMVPFLVSLGHNGSHDWLTGDLAKIYGNRHNMIRMLRSASAPGRRYVLLATDELVLGAYNFNKSPPHIVGLRSEGTKLVTYAQWRPGSTRIVEDSIELEFYDYSTARGRAELESNPDDPRVRPMLRALLNDIIPNELRAPLPGGLRIAQDLARDRYRLFEQLIDNVDPTEQTGKLLGDWLGFGRDF